MNLELLLDNLRAQAEMHLRILTKRKDRYVKAWLAATGVYPTEAVMVVKQWYEGTSTCISIEIKRKEDL